MACPSGPGYGLVRPYVCGRDSLLLPKARVVTPGRALSPLMTEGAGGEGRLLAGSELRHACTVTTLPNLMLAKGKHGEKITDHHLSKTTGFSHHKKKQEQNRNEQTKHLLGNGINNIL